MIMLALMLIAIVVVIFIIAFVGTNKEKGDESVIRHLYVYLVLFATLMMVIGGGISIFMAAADLVSPPSYYQGYGDYKQMRLSGKFETSEGTIVEPSEAELRQEYEQIQKDEKARAQERAKNQIVKSLGFIIIPLPVFLYFNKLRKKQGVE